MWNVMFGRSVVVGGLAFGVERDEQASIGRYKTIIRISNRITIYTFLFLIYLYGDE